MKSLYEQYISFSYDPWFEQEDRMYDRAEAWAEYEQMMKEQEELDYRYEEEEED